MIEVPRIKPSRWLLLSLAAGAYAALVASTPSLTSRAALVVLLALAILGCWTLAAPHRWIAGFMATALLLPPLPIPLGHSSPHPSLLFAFFGILAGAIYFRDWCITTGPLPQALVCLFSILVASTAFAALYSGLDVALQTLARVLLFGVGVYVFFYAAYMRPQGHWSGLRPLFWVAMASAAIACFDFYYQLPAPAGFAPQFIRTGAGLHRRAQGVFYDASTLGNCCAFFLIMIAVAFTRHRETFPISRPALAAGGMVLSAALLLSYSRASVVCLLVALATLAWLDRSRIRWRQAFCLLGFSAAAGVTVSYYFLPQFVQVWWQRFYGSTNHVFDYGDYIFSGRFHSWRVLVTFLAAHPWHLVFGIGYKTLPYSDYIGQKVISDNMYLSMLVETGIIGLVALVWFNIAILGTARRAARNANPDASFFGAWMFCFWLGQCVQMFSADLLTYWRVLPVYFLVLAWAVRASRAPAS